MTEQSDDQRQPGPLVPFPVASVSPLSVVPAKPESSGFMDGSGIPTWYKPLRRGVR